MFSADGYTHASSRCNPENDVAERPAQALLAMDPAREEAHLLAAQVCGALVPSTVVYSRQSFLRAGAIGRLRLS